MLVAVYARLFIGVLGTPERKRNVIQSDLRCRGCRARHRVCVSVDALTARVAADGVPQRHHRALLRHRLVGPIWYNPDYSTGSYSPSYSTGGYYHPGYSIKYHYPLYATSPCISAGTC